MLQIINRTYLTSAVEIYIIIKIFMFSRREKPNDYINRKEKLNRKTQQLSNTTLRDLRVTTSALVS